MLAKIHNERTIKKREMDEYHRLQRLAFISQLTLGSNRFLDEFGQLKTDKERFLCSLKVVAENLTKILDHDFKQKDSEYSITMRKDGNRSFKANQYYKALEEYTESIVYALDSSEELTLAYANRSAVLFKLERFAACLDDIDRALNLKLPDKIKTKLYKRQGLCLMELGRPGAEFAFMEALVWIEKINLSKTEMNKIEKEIREMILDPCPISRPPTHEMQPQLPKVTPNAEIPCASDAVALKHSKKFGRHIVASRKIKPGEIVAVEKPYCTQLMTSYLYTHCSHCLQVSWTLIPCKCCVNVAYCSEACKDEAWDKYHEVECPVIGHSRSFKYNDTLAVALKMVLIATRKGRNLDSIKQEIIDANLNKDPRTKGFADDGKFYSDQFRSVYTLMDNVGKKTTEELVTRTFEVAVAVCLLATKSNMFGEKLALDTLVENPDAKFVGELILKHLHIGSVNMHSFGAARTVRGSEHGHALLAFCSLFNHSCDPNLFRQCYGGHVVLVAVHPIEPGNQLFETYGPLFDRMTKSEREEQMEFWNFKCECIPCIKNWPLSENLPSYKDQRLTPRNEHEIDNALQRFHTHCVTLVRRKTVENSLKMFKYLLKTIELLFNLVQRPCSEFQELMNQLKDFYLSADILYQYEPPSPSWETERYPVFYATLQQMHTPK